MQIIDKPNQKILPFSLRKKMMTQQASSKMETYWITKTRKQKLKIKLKKLEGEKKTKFMSYQLDGIDQVTRKLMKSMLNENLRIFRSKKNGPALLSDGFIQNMSETLKGVSYNSGNYMAIVGYINDIFMGVLGVPEKNSILMAVGQISRNYYLFFDNCFEIPYSLCCNQIIYLKLQVIKQLPKIFTLHKHSNYTNSAQIKSIKTQLICRQCKVQIIYFYGEQTLTESNHWSPQRLKQEIQEQKQRKKFSIGIMVSSGKYKNYRIDTNNKYQSSLLRRFNPESIFAVSPHNKKLTSARDETTLYNTVSLSQPKSLRNDFYHVFNQ